MKKTTFIICLLTFLVLPKLSFGQKNISEFNQQDAVILRALENEVQKIGGGDLSFGRAYENPPTITEINNYLTHSNFIVAKAKERIQICKNAIETLPQLPDREIKGNDDFKSWTKSHIGRYESLIKYVESNIIRAQDLLNRTKTK